MDAEEFDLEEVVKVPARKTWRNHTLPVRAQGACRYASWSIASAAALEVQVAAKSKVQRLSNRISVQQILDCAPNTRGCLGGSVASVAVLSNKTGNAFEKNYPYVAKTKKCNAALLKNATKFGVASKPIVSLNGNTTRVQRMLLARPLVAYIDGTAVARYSRGVFNGVCRGASHTVTLVGYTTNATTGAVTWIASTSFGPRWGEAGYIRLADSAKAGTGCYFKRAVFGFRLV